MRNVPYSLGWFDVREKPSGKFEARWADETGRARGKCFMTKAQARRYAQDKARNVSDSAVGLSVLEKGFQEAAENWLSTFQDEGTRRIYTRHLEDFYGAMSDVKLVEHLTEDIITRYDRLLAEAKWPDGRARHNPGGRRHVLKTFKALARYCVRRKWLAADPFLDFRMPQSTFESRALDPGELSRLMTPDPRYEVDEHIKDLITVMQETTIRSETAWSLTPADFREPAQMFIHAQKGQEPVWITLNERALAVIRRRLIGRRAGQRLFDYWPSVDAMRQAFRKKARREGLAGVRPHDAGKVTRVTQLLAAGYNPKELEHITNTGWKTLMGYYAKADRRRTFEKYRAFSFPGAAEPLGTKSPEPKSLGLPPAGSDLHQTYGSPETGINGAETRPQEPTDTPKSNGGIGFKI